MQSASATEAFAESMCAERVSHGRYGEVGGLVGGLVHVQVGSGGLVGGLVGGFVNNDGRRVKRFEDCLGDSI